MQMSDPIMKTCKDCQRTLVRSENFYVGGNIIKNTYQARCKPCHNRNRSNYANNTVRVARVRTRMTLSSFTNERRDEITQAITSGMKVKQIAVKFDVSAPAIYKWRKLLIPSNP